jgi:asparagine synthase (glutamine-hydrolysing)
MCGIFGILYRDGRTAPDPARLARSAALLGHRGPDGHGTHAEPGLGFAHTRLSLLDLTERGAQPFWDRQERRCLVYNGEVYNFEELRTELEQEGVSFRSGTDTEVILEAIIRHGLDAVLPRLEGMFAFALWDRETRVLTLARDRFGIKPISYYEDDHCLVFGSEIKAFSPWVTLRPDLVSASAYLLGSGGPTRDHTFFAGTRMLPPGTVLQAGGGGPSTSRSYFPIWSFWDEDRRAELAGLRPAQIVDRFEERLLASVRKHLIADAPVGALCSGGLDSSVIMAMAARHHNNLAVFHANVVGPLSEYDAAKTLAKHLKLELKAVPVRDADYIELMPRVVEHCEFPFAYHLNSIPFLKVALLVRDNGVKAVLSGEGSDECYLGYSVEAYRDLRLALQRFRLRSEAVMRRVPLLGKIAGVPDGALQREGYDILNRFEMTLDQSEIRQAVERLAGGPVRPRERRSLELMCYHLQTVLQRNDFMGMAASIEARFPFLDHELVRDAVNLSSRYKIRPGFQMSDRSHPFLIDKWVVRRVADRYLPRVLSRRKKLGFPISVFARLSVDREYFRGSQIAELFQLSAREQAHLFDVVGHGMLVRVLLMEIWARRFLDGQPYERVAADLLRSVRVRPPAAAEAPQST